MILKYFIIFLVPIIGISTLSKQNKALVDSLIRHYSIQSIVMLSDKMVDLENYFENSLKTSVSYEIHTQNEFKSNLRINTDIENLLFMIANNYNSLVKS